MFQQHMKQPNAAAAIAANLFLRPAFFFFFFSFVGDILNTCASAGAGLAATGEGAAMAAGSASGGISSSGRGSTELLITLKACA